MLLSLHLDLRVSNAVVGLPSKNVSGLTVQGLTDRLERRKPDRLGPAVLEHRQICWRNANELGKRADGHFASGQHDVDIHNNGHLDHPVQFGPQVACISVDGDGLDQQSPHDHHQQGDTG